jgi:hypothetical protein
MGTAWQMPIAVIGKPTGDGRQFDAGALTHRDLPLPFRYVAEDSGGHTNAVIVGHISKVGKEAGGMLPAEGEFYDDDAWPDDVRNAATAARMFVANKVIGPSVDLDKAEIENVPEPKAYADWKKLQAGKLRAAKAAYAGKNGTDCGCGGPVMAEEAYEGPRLKMVREGRFASATLVHIPAFAELSGHAKLTPIDSHDPNVDGTTASLKIENDREVFQTIADLGKLFEDDDAEFASDDDEMSETVIPRKKKKLDPEKVKGNQDDEEFGSGIWLSDAEFEEFAKRKLPSQNKASAPEQQGTDAEQGQGGGGIGGGTYAAPDVTKAGVRNKLADEDFVDPEGRRFPIASCADVSDAVSSYGRANPKIPMATFRKRLTAIAKRKGCEGSLPENWKAGEKMAALMAGAAAPAFAPPKSAFDDPKFDGPHPVTVADDRTLSGHVAVWETCHVGIGNSCVTPPHSNTGYAYFHTGEVVTADGSRLPVGRLTYGGGHAKPNLGYAAAAEHYDQTSSVGAYVRAGEDEYGIWVAGVLAPEVDEDGVRQMRAAPLSGDWRRIAGNLEMVAALHVNTAGFPIPRVVTASLGAVEGEMLLSLVAAGTLPVIAEDEDALNALAASAAADWNGDTEALGRAIARGMLAEQQEQAAASAKAAEWRELVAAATSDNQDADYHEVMGDLMVALVE